MCILSVSPSLDASVFSIVGPNILILLLLLFSYQCPAGSTGPPPDAAIDGSDCFSQNVSGGPGFLKKKDQNL